MQGPFESLARGLDKDLRILFVPKGSDQSRMPNPNRLAAGFGVGEANVPLRSTKSEQHYVGRQSFGLLNDRFSGEIAIFPLTDHVVINKFGAFIPQSLFGSQTDLAYSEQRNSTGEINITIHAKQEISAAVRPRFGSASGLIRISDDFNEPLEDFVDYM